jgi:hypothetical protein
MNFLKGFPFEPFGISDNETNGIVNGGGGSPG